jgi:hypothetical protein
MPSPDQFSRHQTLDLETAMATAVSDNLKDQVFPGAGGLGVIRFQEVFSEWPTANDRHVSPAACVTPVNRLLYSEARLTPSLLEDTWEPRGMRGFGLYALAEGTKDFEVVIRAATKAERRALVAGIEGLFLAPGVLNNRAQGARYGVVQTMPEYWGLLCRLSLQDKQLEDTEESAQKNRWEATFLVRAQAPLVKLDVVTPFKVKIVEQIE